MAVRIKKLSIIILGFALLAVVGIKTQSKNTLAQAVPTCPSGFSLLVPNAIPGGNITLNLDSLATSTPTIQDTIFKIDNAILGRGVQAGTTPQYQILWYTQTSLPGQHTISAQINFTDGNSCLVNPIPTNLTSTATAVPQLNAAVNPGNYQGLSNQAIPFALSASIGSTSGSGVNITPYTYFANKSTTIGSITPLDGSSILRLSTGPAAGSGVATVVASYGGLTKTLSIPLSILAQTTSGEGSTPLPPSTTTQTPTKNTTTSTPQQPVATTAASNAATAAASTASVEADKQTKDCVQLKLGEARYKLISTGQARPTASEFESMNQCFATRNYVLPSSFVPIPPAQVKEQPESKEVAVSKPSNTTNGSTTKLNFKGKAKPNSVVLLYVYSEPLVLSTTADKNGDWSYSLEDPLQPGNHEIYAVVNKGDGTYQRSSVLDFAIQKAEASAANPNSYSLKLGTIEATAKDPSNSSTVYLIGVGAITAAMLGTAGFVLLRQKNKKNKPTIDQTTQPVTTDAAQSTVNSPTPVTEQAVAVSTIAQPPESAVQKVEESITPSETIIQPQTTSTNPQEPLTTAPAANNVEMPAPAQPIPQQSSNQGTVHEP